MSDPTVMVPKPTCRHLLRENSNPLANPVRRRRWNLQYTVEKCGRNGHNGVEAWADFSGKAVGIQIHEEDADKSGG